MKISSLLSIALLTAAGLAACDRPTVVNTPPAATVAVPGPAGSQGEPGKPGNTNIVVVPAPAPAAPAASEPK